MRGEALAQIRALDDPWEFLRRVNVKLVAKAGREDGSGGSIEGLGGGGGADVYKIHLQSGRGEKVSFGAVRKKGIGLEKTRPYVPESTLGAHTEILQDEPDAHFVVRIREFEGADAETADEIPREHATRLRTGI